MPRVTAFLVLRIKRRCGTPDFHMSLYWHLGYLKQIELTIHIHDLLSTVKLPLTLTVDEVFKGDPSSGFCWMTPFSPMPQRME